MLITLSYGREVTQGDPRAILRGALGTAPMPDGLYPNRPGEPWDPVAASAPLPRCKRTNSYPFFDINLKLGPKTKF